MSLRKLTNAFNKNKEKKSSDHRRDGSSSSGWLSKSSRHTSTVSLPDAMLTSNQQRFPSPTFSNPSSATIKPSHAYSASGHSETPLRVVAPFVYIPPPRESSASSVRSHTSDDDHSTLKVKRSFSKLLSPRDEAPTTRHESTETFSTIQEAPEDAYRRPRKSSLFGGNSFFEEPQSSSLSSTANGARKIASWIGEKQTGVARKVQDVLKSSRVGSSSETGPSVVHAGYPAPEFNESDDEPRSSVSSADSFVQTAPDDEFRAMIDTSPPLVTPPIPSMPTQYLPRSHTTLHALTLSSLAFPPSPHPLLYSPVVPAFPRSSNHSSKLPRLPTFRAHLAKTRILDRLEAQDLDQQDNESILPFGLKDPPGPNQDLPVLTDQEISEIRKITDDPGWSVGLEAWTRRLPFVQRARVWYSSTAHASYNGENLKYEAITTNRPIRSELKFSGGVMALAGLVERRPISILPLYPADESPSALQFPLTPSTRKSVVIDESMLMDNIPIPIAAPQPSFPESAPAISPRNSQYSVVPALRPLPTIPTQQRPRSKIFEVPETVSAGQEVKLPDVEESNKPASFRPLPIPVRKLPPRPLPLPPSSPQVTMREVESIEGPLVVTTAVFDSDTSPNEDRYHASDQYLSHTPHPMSSSMTSVPHTPLDPLEAESLRRLSVSSISAMVSGTSGFSLEGLDGIETIGHMADRDKRRSFRVSATPTKRQSSALPLPPIPTSFRQSSGSLLPQSVSESNSVDRWVPTNTSSGSLSTPPSEPSDNTNSNSRSGVSVTVVDTMDSSDTLAEAEMKRAYRASDGYLDPFQSTVTLASMDIPPPSPPPPLPTSRVPRSTVSSPATTASLPFSSYASISDHQRSTSTSSQSNSASIKSNQSPPQTPVSSLTQYNEGENAPGSAFPVKVVKLKHSRSNTADLESTNGSTNSNKLLQLDHSSSKFWPRSRRADDNERAGDKDVISNDSYTSLSEDKSSTTDTTVRPPGSSTASLSRTDIDEQNDVVPPEPISLPNLSESQSRKHIRNLSSSSRPSLEDGSRNGNLPLSIAFDIGRLASSTPLDLTLINPQRSPPSSSSSGTIMPLTGTSPPESEFPHSSAPATLMRPMVPADVKDIAAHLPLSPSSSISRSTSRHCRTTSSERAARIEAHLDSVQATRSSHRQGDRSPPLSRPEFLPIPDQLRFPALLSRQMRRSDEMTDSTSTSDQSSLDGGSPRSLHVPTSVPPKSNAPARWSEAAWRERQRSLNMLPLPSASISPSATKSVPLGAIYRPSKIVHGGLTSPSIFAQPTSQTGLVHKRSLRM